LDADRLRQLGAPVQGVLGNLKFDATPIAHQIETGRRWRASMSKPVVMLAVSREGEELALLEKLKTFYLLVDTNKGNSATDKIAIGVQWLIVPRHPQRFDSVAALISAQGFGLSRRSQWDEAGPDGAGTAQVMNVWLGDSLGEMALYYGLADVALLGGSFEPLGGQNLIEAAACGCPIVMGPHTFNFAEAAQQALLAGAALRVEQLQPGLQTAVELALDTADLRSRQQACGRFAQAYRGAAGRLAREVRPSPILNDANDGLGHRRKAP
jgi:3-deoxy-D-manno-octulosonic-acid transferase